jgi:hypothetical protein
MARLNLKSFAQPDLLKKIQPANLLSLLEPFRLFLEMKEFLLPTEPPDEMDTGTLAAILAQRHWCSIWLRSSGSRWWTAPSSHG